MSTSTSGPGLGRSAAVMASGTAASRVLGLLRTVVLVAAIGSATVAANAFAAANWLPNAIYMLIAGGVLNAVLVPQIVKADRDPRGHEFVDRLLSVSMALLLAATAVLVLAAPLVVSLAVGGPGEERDARFVALTLAFAYLTLPQVFFYGLYTLLGQVLNARRMFGPYMWAPVVNNVVAIAGIALFMALYDTGPESAVGTYGFWTSGPVLVLAGTATLGVVAQALVLLVPLRRSGFRFRPRLGWRGVGLGGAARLAGWTFAALVVGQVGIWVVTRVTSGAAQAQQDAIVAGNAHYTNAFMIFMLPHSLVTVSLLTALYTRIAGHATSGDVPAVRRDWSAGLRTLGVFTTFATALLVVLALPVSRLVLIGDRPEAAAAMTPVVVALAVGLVPLGVWSLVQRVHYAYEDARTLFRLQVPMAVLVSLGAWGASAVLPVPWWTVGACAAISASYVLGAAAGVFRVRARVGPLRGEAVALHGKAAAGALAAAAAGWPVGRLFGDLSRAGLVRAALACVVVGAVMLAVYVGVLRLLRVRELDEMAAPVLRRLAPLVARLSPGAGRAMARAGSGRTMAPGRAAADGMGGPVLSGPGGADRAGGGRRVTSELARGTVLAGRYRLEEPSTSDLPGVECWTARDRVLDRPVRACLLLEGRIVQAQDAARRAALVADPRLVKVLDVGDHDGVAYVVTGPLPGRTLGELVAQRPLDPEHARAVVGEAAVALETARRRGVHHLALRASSVRVTEDGQVLVAGLGMDGELADHGLGDARSTTRADTVGLVALLYLALTGRWPVPDGAPLGDVPVAPQVDGGPVPPGDLATVPNDLDTLCTVTLGPNDDGPHSPAELVGDLEPWQDVDGRAIHETANRPAGPGPTSGTPSASAGAAGAAAATAALMSADGASAEPTGAPETPGDDDEVAVAEVVTEATPTSVAAVSRTSVQETFDNTPPTAAPRPETPPPAIPPRRHVPRPDTIPVGAPNPHGVTVASSATSTGPGTGRATSPAAPVLGRPTWPGGPVAPGRPPAGDGRPATTSRARPEPPRGPREEVDLLVGRSKEVLTGRAAFDPTPWVLTLFLAAVIIGVVVAWQALTAPAPPIGGSDGFGDVRSQETEEATEPAGEGDGEGEGDAEGASEPPPETETPSAPPVIVGAQQIDPPPQGDNNEHPEAVDRAIDDDPESYWFSRTYASPTYGMKPGIGFAVTLEEPAQVSKVTLSTNSVGGNVQIRATDPSTPTAGDPLAEGPMENETTFEFDPVEATHVVLWFTELPQIADGRNRVELTNLTVE